MANDDFFDFDFAGMQMQVNELISRLDKMAGDVDEGAVQAAQEAAEIIAKEQRRLLSAAVFKEHKADLASLIKVRQAQSKKYFRLAIGYDSAAIQQHPELLVIEFGRPGKSARRMKATDSLGRKKGDFPPVTPHIIPGFYLGKEDAGEHFRQKLLEIAQRRWENGG